MKGKYRDGKGKRKKECPVPVHGLRGKEKKNGMVVLFFEFSR
jgi:hypothetical protein